jgi:N-acetyl-anhydromuramyl-L-alanine amidase AmpD
MSAPPAPAPVAMTPIPAAKVEAPVILEPLAPLSSTFQQSSDYRSGGDKARKIDLIILHCTEGAWASALRWLTTKDATPVSAHYMIGKDGRLVQMVAVNDVAYAAGGTKEKPSSWRGRGDVNGRSVNIELENKNDGRDPYPPVQIAVCLWLVLRICRGQSVFPDDVVGHYDVDPGRKTDPAGFPMDQFRKSVDFHLNNQTPGGIA